MSGLYTQIVNHQAPKTHESLAEKPKFLLPGSIYPNLVVQSLFSGTAINVEASIRGFLPPNLFKKHGLNRSRSTQILLHRNMDLHEWQINV